MTEVKTKPINVHIPENEHYEFKVSLLKRKEKIVDAIRRMVRDYIEETKRQGK